MNGLICIGWPWIRMNLLINGGGSSYSYSVWMCAWRYDTWDKIFLFLNFDCKKSEPGWHFTAATFCRNASTLADLNEGRWLYIARMKPNIPKALPRGKPLFSLQNILLLPQFLLFFFFWNFLKNFLNFLICHLGFRVESFLK